jgi:hypothetical protein
MNDLTFNISYSLLSKYLEHKQGALCGYRFEQQTIRKAFEEPQGDLAAAGQWAEYMMTGALPRDGKVPEPVKTAKGEFTAMYKHLNSQAKVNFPIVYQDVKILEVGKEIIFEHEGYRFKMVLDVLSEEVFKTQIRDIKTTGNFNEWQGGWAHTNKHPFWDNPHILQAKIYIWAWWKLNQEIPDFFFDVFANNDPDNFEVFEIRMNESSLLYFEGELLDICRELRVKSQIEGFEPLPTFKRCRQCKELTNIGGETLYDLCSFKALKVTPIIVNVP